MGRMRIIDGRTTGMLLPTETAAPSFLSAMSVRYHFRSGDPFRERHPPAIFRRRR